MLRVIITIFLFAISLNAAIINVGLGSYTTTFPGNDIAGRNGYPGGSPQLSGNAIGKPVPSNDWWSNVLISDHSSNLFNYPMAMRTQPEGLGVGLVVPVSTANGSSEPLGPTSPIIIGVNNLSSSKTTVDDYSDWTVTFSWSSNNNSFKATSGIAMPFLYFQKGDNDIASVIINDGEVSIHNELLLVQNSQDGAQFAIYAPTGSVWTQSGTTYTSSLNGYNYWSMAFLPSGNALSVANLWKQFAYVEPTDTRVSWSYDEQTSICRTEFSTSVKINEGSNTNIIQGLLPHQWAHLSQESNSNISSYSLDSIRGEIKLLTSNSFSTERIFHGILPTLPVKNISNDNFNPSLLDEKIRYLEDEPLSTWTDSYNEGQVMNRLVQTARIANEMGNIESRNKILNTIKDRLEDWLSAENGEVAFLFYYQPTWTSLIGYPAGHGQDTNLNDHHFHWGYFIHAASFLEQFQPGWATQWGSMVNLLISDAANIDRSNTLFPFLRNFSPFAGHSWANGFATFPFGNDQESSSESMQFNSALIHWGSIINNTQIRDLGIYLYTTEQSAIEEYWFDINNRTFKPGYGYSLASRLWGNGYDNQTFWTSDIAAAYGIELYPIHAGSLYLGHNQAYAQSLWNEITQNTGILSHQANDNLWHDTYYKFLSFINPDLALQLYQENQDRSLKFGISDAQTYHWLHAMKELGEISTSITANDPLAVVFNNNDEKTYVAQNYDIMPKDVIFSDGFKLHVPPNTLATSDDLPVSGSISTPFDYSLIGNTIQLSLNVFNPSNLLTAVDFYNGNALLGRVSNSPYIFQTDGFNAGSHNFYAKLYCGNDFVYSDFAKVIIGEQYPFSGVLNSIPGTFEAGLYDEFEGGLGQNISYYDTSIGNNGNSRSSEYVDVQDVNGEGKTVGWIADGEWLEYTVNVQSSGIYEVDFRYACNNSQGGGPFYFKTNGTKNGPSKSVQSTGNWSSFSTSTISGIELLSGKQILRIHFDRGELNLGRLTFRKVGELPIASPVANAGIDQIINNNQSSASLNGLDSTLISNQNNSYLWEQLTGPKAIVIDNPTLLSSSISDLTIDGTYRFRLTITDNNYSVRDEVDYIRGDIASLPPSVSIINPASNSSALAGNELMITVQANDTDGDINEVNIFNKGIHLETLTSSPYNFSWSPPVGEHELYARVVDSDLIAVTSSVVYFSAIEPISCRTEVNEDFDYEFSADSSNPTITFIPKRTGVGVPTLLFYYGTGSGPWPGYSISPNIPFSLNVSEGETIGFYFTYSSPDGGERNTLNDNMSYTIGTCAAIQSSENLKSNWLIQNFNQSDLDNSSKESTLWGDYADPDNDGIVNLFEFITGSDPMNHSAYPLEWINDPFSNDIHIRFYIRSGLSNNYGLIQWSTNLLNDWTSDNVIISPIELVDGIQSFQADFNESDTNSSIFVRQIVD